MGHTVDEAESGLVKVGSEAVRVYELTANVCVSDASQHADGRSKRDEGLERKKGWRGRREGNALGVSHRVVDSGHAIKLVDNLEVYDMLAILSLSAHYVLDGSEGRDGGSGTYAGLRRWAAGRWWPC